MESLVGNMKIGKRVFFLKKYNQMAEIIKEKNVSWKIFTNFALFLDIYQVACTLLGKYQCYMPQSVYIFINPGRTHRWMFPEAYALIHLFTAVMFNLGNETPFSFVYGENCEIRWIWFF